MNPLLNVKKIKEIMSTPVQTTSMAASVMDAASIMAENKIGAIVITQDKDILGIVTERDIATKVAAKDKLASKIHVEEIMTRNIITVNSGMTIYEASAIMKKEGIRRLPVVDERNLVGIVTETDLEEALHESLVDDLKLKIKELELFNKMAIGRELKMVELKRKLEELELKHNS